MKINPAQVSSFANLTETYTDLVTVPLARRTAVWESALQTGPCVLGEGPAGLQIHLRTRMQRQRNHALGVFHLSNISLLTLKDNEENYIHVCTHRDTQRLR
jgi:hypothetical protein